SLLVVRVSAIIDSAFELRYASDVVHVVYRAQRGTGKYAKPDSIRYCPRIGYQSELKSPHSKINSWEQLARHEVTMSAGRASDVLNSGRRWFLNSKPRRSPCPACVQAQWDPSAPYR